MLGKLRSVILVLTLVLAEGSLGSAGPIINILNYNTGAPGSLFNIVGTSLYTSPGTNSVTFTGPIGTSSQATTATVKSWSATELDNITVPTSLGTGMYGVQVTSGGAPSNMVDFDVTLYAGTNVDPHSGFSTSTNYCSQCHTVHSGQPYGLLSGTSVTQVCEQCHAVSVYNSSSPTGTPQNQFNTQAVGTTSYLNVYVNTTYSSTGIHAMGSLLSGNINNLDTNVTLGYLNLNSTGYQESGFYPPSSPHGLGCDSCHTAHGSSSAERWTGWDASQFSVNYGYNVDGSVYNDPFAGHNESWRLPTGAVPLTNALLVANPGYQGGINNTTSNPFIPVETDSPTSRTWGQTTPGWGDNNLSNWCLGCHNLAVGGASGHNAHPEQAAANPAINAPSGGSFAPITQGCMDCHGNPLASVWNSVYQGNNFYSFIYPSSGTLTWDFPHTSTNPYFLKNYDSSSTKSLCGTCHTSQTNF